MIFILELVCGDGHCLESIAWDDETHTEMHAAYGLGLLALPTLPVCRICHSTSTLLRNLPTTFTSLEQAARSREGCQVLQ